MRYWVSLFQGKEVLSKVYKSCSGKNVFVVSRNPSKGLLENLLDGILKEKPRDLLVYFLGTKVEREGVRSFDPKDEENWMPIRRGILRAPQTSIAAPLILSERVIVVMGIAKEKRTSISLVTHLFQGISGNELLAYSLFRPDFTIYEVFNKGIIVSNSRILAEIALNEVLEEKSLNEAELKALTQMEPIPKEYEILGGEEFREKIERRIENLLRGSS